MQGRFAFTGRDDLLRWREALHPLIADMELLPPRPPIGQLVKSLISGRTRDAVSQDAFERLCRRFPTPALLANAAPSAVLREIRAVTYPEDKARHLLSALHRIGRERPDYRLEFLAAPPLDDALGWLERLDGVGRKVAASALNASTLSRPIFIVDSHVIRVLRRLAFVERTAEPRHASEQVTALMAEWSGSDFLLFHVALKRLGQTHCHDGTPHCRGCPLARWCPSRQGD